MPRSQLLSRCANACGVDGTVSVPLDEAAGDRDRGAARRGRIEAVAVCFLHSYANPEHERRCAARFCGRLLPDVVVTTSSEVLPEFREYERFSTTALNAYVAPRMRRYLGELRRPALTSAGMSARLAIMTSNGGTLPATRVEAMPVLSMLSGPAAGVIAAGHVGARRRLSRSHHLRHGRNLDRCVPGARRRVTP